MTTTQTEVNAMAQKICKHLNGSPQAARKVPCTKYGGLPELLQYLIRYRWLLASPGLLLLFAIGQCESNFEKLLNKDLMIVVEPLEPLEPLERRLAR